MTGTSSWWHLFLPPSSNICVNYSRGLSVTLPNRARKWIKAIVVILTPIEKPNFLISNFISYGLIPSQIYICTTTGLRLIRKHRQIITCFFLEKYLYPTHSFEQRCILQFALIEPISLLFPKATHGSPHLDLLHNRTKDWGISDQFLWGKTLLF